MPCKQPFSGGWEGNHRWEITASIDDWSPETSSVWVGHKVIESQSQRKRAGVRGLMIWMEWWWWYLTCTSEKRNTKHRHQNRNLSKCHKSLGVLDGMCLIYLFLAVLRTSLFSLETASVLSHSNLKIEMSLLGCIAVMAATSFGLFNCAVNISGCDIFCSISSFIFVYLQQWNEIIRDTDLLDICIHKLQVSIDVMLRK